MGGKRITAAEHYIGSLREAKRAAFLAGAEAALDLFMKAADSTVKKVKADGEIPREVQVEINTIIMQLSSTLYRRVIGEIMTSTPFEPQIAVKNEDGFVTIEREPGTAERE